MDISLILRDFEYKLNLLKDFPERNMILDLTKISEIHISLAEFLSNIIAAKVVDPMTNITYKLPIFYLMDSIMKNVGGPYAALFGRHLLEIFSRTFTEVPTKDREKLDFLLGTWEERQVTCLKDRKIFMPENVLPSIREFVNTKKKTTLIADTQSNQLKRPRIETTMHGQGRAHQLPLPGPGQVCTKSF